MMKISDHSDKQSTEVTRAPTGIDRLDEVLRGGIPVPSLVLLLGDVGTGKSVICQQFLYKQAQMGLYSVYLCIDHPPEEVRENMRSLGWNTEKLEEEGLLKFIDLFLGRGYDYEYICSTLEKYIKESNRFVVDSISSIAFIYGEKLAYDLIQKIQGWNREGRGVGIINAVRGMHSQSFEVALQQACSNVILLEMKENGRFLRVVKTTRTSHMTEEFGVEIDEAGIRLL
ncbi:RAD55 family ATPase [Archaeoglobus veneficus]|uniref:Putative circadian clock protein, KaiC n=1 Tax=Archaeoglobus veneficus (strain DSM 11195 / SNP6) TaxID=693661 RepID=F2KQU9_ARCVS|nr:ATPase domain-containing protein [Archaeoglobus veneficus]AEA47755.1 putative circadian clock protein, KaiC [Archaeoglobus veneficus SNP6]